MPGGFHIIGIYFRVPKVAPALCGEQLSGRELNSSCCNAGVANPGWSHDWCHDCVRSLPWNDEERRLWRKRGITDTLNVPEWKEWLQTPCGEHARRILESQDSFVPPYPSG